MSKSILSSIQILSLALSAFLLSSSNFAQESSESATDLVRGEVLNRSYHFL